MHWLDTSALLIVTGTALVGAALGFVRPVIRLTTLVLAAVAARLVSPAVADAVGGPNGVPAHPAVFVGVTFVAALVILSVAAALLRRWFWEALPVSAVDTADGLRWLDRLAGAVAGAAVAAALVGTAVGVIDLTADAPARGRMVGSQTLAHARARFAGPAKAVTDDQKARLDEAAEWLKRKTDAEKTRPAPPAPANDKK